MITFTILASQQMTVQDYFDLYRVQTPGCIGIWDNKLKFVVNNDNGLTLTNVDLAIYELQAIDLGF